MSEFNAAHALDEVKERREQAAEGEKLVPILAAIIAVFAALGTLFANHSSISGLATKNEAILTKSKAVDQWNYYQAKEIKYEIDHALIISGASTSASGLRELQKNVGNESNKASQAKVLAGQLDKRADDEYEQSERFMQSYERYEISATLFEVSIVLVSITALMRNKGLLYVGGAATLLGLIFFLQGWLTH